jgi:large subunit ribosomal protein L10
MRPEKANIVDDLTSKLNSSPFLFVADYAGLRVGQFSELRNRLHKVGARCNVVKNTFLRRAVADAGLPELDSVSGQTAIVTGDKDVAAAAKVLKTFASEFKKPAIKSGIIDRLIVSGDQIQAIADLPSREILLSQLLALLNTPATMLVRVLNEPATALARVFQAHVDAQGGAEAPAGDEAAPAPEAAAEGGDAAPSADAAPAPDAAPAA